MTKPARRPFSRVLSKVGEASFYLDQFSKTWKNSEAGYYFSAYASAARGVTWVLQAVMKRLDGFDSWYKEKQKALGDHPVSRFLHEARNELEHVGIEPTRYRGVVSRFHKGHAHCRRLYRFVNLENREFVPPDGDVVDGSHDHLVRLAAIVRECYERFRDVVDSEGTLSAKVETITTIPRIEATVCPLERESGRPLLLKARRASRARVRRATRGVK